MKINYTVEERFLRYVKIDTQSDPRSESYPSTEKQKDLGRLLVKELKEMGLTDARMDEYGYVYATIESNTDKDVPVICFCAHLDTSPDFSGANVRPVVHRNYDGKDIVLPADPRQVISVRDFPELEEKAGQDIITADGTTLLGADNKAGIAELMDAAWQMVNHPEIKHGTIKLLFTPDEEIARDTEHLDIDSLDVDYAYTVDAHRLGTVNDESFAADRVRLEITGAPIHTGGARNRMENAIKIATEIIERLPKTRMSPESTYEREGFIHPSDIEGNIGKATITFQVRAFDREDLDSMEDYLEQVVENVMSRYKRSSYTLDIMEQDQNMKEVLKDFPKVVDLAAEAVKRAGVEPIVTAIRAATTGSSLSFMGLPTPNIFTGQHGVHGKLEWVCVQDMQKAVDTILHLCAIWEEKGSTVKKQEYASARR